MALAIRSGSLKTGDKTDIVLNNRIRSAGVSMQSCSLSYDKPPTGEPGNKATMMSRTDVDIPENDHHVQDIKASVSIVSVDGERVTIRADGEIRDASNNVGGGTITYILIADTD